MGSTAGLWVHLPPVSEDLGQGVGALWVWGLSGAPRAFCCTFESLVSCVEHRRGADRVTYTRTAGQLSAAHHEVRRRRGTARAAALEAGPMGRDPLPFLVSPHVRRARPHQRGSGIARHRGAVQGARRGAGEHTSFPRRAARTTFCGVHVQWSSAGVGPGSIGCARHPFNMSYTLLELPNENLSCVCGYWPHMTTFHVPNLTRAICVKPQLYQIYQGPPFLSNPLQCTSGASGSGSFLCG